MYFFWSNILKRFDGPLLISQILIGGLVLFLGVVSCWGSDKMRSVGSYLGKPTSFQGLWKKSKTELEVTKHVALKVPKPGWEPLWEAQPPRGSEIQVLCHKRPT